MSYSQYWGKEVLGAKVVTHNDLLKKIAQSENENSVLSTASHPFDHDSFERLQLSAYVDPPKYLHKIKLVLSL